MDDNVTSNALQDKRMTSLMSKMRHMGISICICMQYYKSTMKPGSRDQFTDILIGSVNSAEMLENLLKEVSNGAGSNKKEALQNLMKHYNHAISSDTRNGHNFLRVQTDKLHG